MEYTATKHLLYLILSTSLLIMCFQMIHTINQDSLPSKQLRKSQLDDQFGRRGTREETKGTW